MVQVLNPIDILQTGVPVDEVTLSIDYQIIEHFSRHLYGSPNKAVEELISNAFDAFATQTYIYLPGKYTSNHVLVWDNGSAMDVTGLKQLWWIARSPKGQGDRVVYSGEAERKVIGKFGIGKLASYAVGRRITHFCRQGAKFLMVSIDYTVLDGEKGEPVSSNNPYQTPILLLKEADIRQHIESLFNDGTKPKAIKELFEGESWTLAVISDLRKDISRARLMWLLGNGMPLRPDFKVFVDDDPVTSKIESKADVSWDFGAQKVKQSIEAAWEKASKAGKIEGDLQFGSQKGLDPAHPTKSVPYVEFPHLKHVTGDVRLFKESLATGKAADVGRSHGFFVLIRGRLLNPDDEQLLLNYPSFGTFYRSQFVIRIDIDEDLLADRERMRRDTAGTTELSILQSALYGAARAELENRDNEEAEKEKSESFLPLRSREFYREPLTSLLMNADLPDGVAFNIAKPKISREPIGDDQPMSLISPQGDGFQINTEHPYYLALERRFGKAKKAQMFFRALDMIAVSERLLEGYLYDVGVVDEKVKQVAEWRDGLFRELAKSYEKAPSDLAINFLNASYEGNEAFENALAELLGNMGLKCERDGAPGKKDVLVVAPIGTASYTLTFEPKGSVKALPNDKAEISGAAAHRKEAGAEHSVVVAREFVGFGKDGGREDAAVLNECKESGKVSIMTVDALIALHEAVEQFGYPLDLMKDIFCVIETPKAKLERIRSLQMPTQDFNYWKLLNDIWKRQGSESSDDYVPYKHVYQSNQAWKKTMNMEEFERKLVALETLAGGLILLELDRREIVLRQAPERIIEIIERNLLPSPVSTNEKDKG